jgi:hypothetical protein
VAETYLVDEKRSVVWVIHPGAREGGG